jgi:hypothetical protein
MPGEDAPNEAEVEAEAAQAEETETETDTKDAETAQENPQHRRFSETQTA